MSVLHPTFPSTTMEQAPLFCCHNCKSSKPKDQFELHKTSNKYGAQGVPLSRCSSCVVKEQDRNEKRKRKRDEDGNDMSRVPAGPNRVISIDQFMAMLREQCLTGVISFSAHVSIQGSYGEEDGICTVIAGHVWGGHWVPVHVWVVSAWGSMANIPFIQSDIGWKLPKRMVPANGCTNAVKQQRAAITAGRGPRWSLNKTAKAETPAKYLASLATDCCMWMCRMEFLIASWSILYENCHTLPKTNETDCRGQLLLRNVIGYMSFDK